MSKGLKDTNTTYLKEIPLYKIQRDSSNYFVHQHFAVEDIYEVALSHSVRLEIDALYINFIATSSFEISFNM